MWASAPTNDHEKLTNFEGGQGRPPLQVTVKNNDSLSSTPTRGMRNHASPAKNRNILFYAVGVDAHIDPSRRPNGNTPRRGGRLCPPAENPAFLGDLRRIRTISTLPAGISRNKHPRVRASRSHGDILCVLFGNFPEAGQKRLLRRDGDAHIAQAGLMAVDVHLLHRDLAGVRGLRSGRRKTAGTPRDRARRGHRACRQGQKRPSPAAACGRFAQGGQLAWSASAFCV